VVLPAERTARVRGRALMLSLQELRLLEELARHPDRIMLRQELFRLAWGREMRPGDRSVDVYVRRLRVKLERALPGWRFIHTHFGFGYRLRPEPSQLGEKGFPHGSQRGSQLGEKGFPHESQRGSRSTGD